MSIGAQLIFSFNGMAPLTISLFLCTLFNVIEKLTTYMLGSVSPRWFWMHQVDKLTVVEAALTGFGWGSPGRDGRSRRMVLQSRVSDGPDEAGPPSI